MIRSRSGLAGLALLTVLANVPGSVAGVDEEIAFYQERVARDPGDFITAGWLAGAYLRKARVSCDDAFVARADAATERALGLMPNHAPALVARAAVRNAQHRFPEALVAARRATGVDPTSPDAWAVLGDTELNRGALAAARAAYDAAHARAPGFASLARSAAWRQSVGDDAGAFADFARALEAGVADGNPPAEIAWVRVQRGAQLFARGRFDDAEADYEAARRHEPEGCTVLARLAELRAAQGRFDDAAALYEPLGARVDRPDLQQTIGDFYAAFGKAEPARSWHDRAEAGYRRTIEAGDVRYLHHLAGFYTDVRFRPAEAVELARKDLALRQTSAAYDVLAWALHHARKSAEARVAIDRALAAGGAEPHLMQHAALIYAADGASEAGAALLKRAYALNPNLDRFHAHQ